MTEEMGRDHTPQIRPYDFRSPERLTSSTRRSLEPNQGMLAGYLTDALSEALAIPCTVRFEKLAENSSEEFLSNEKIATYSLKPVAHRGDILVQLESPLAQAFVDRLVGGPGEPRAIDRAPTDIEVALLQSLAGDIGSSTARSWNSETAPAGEPAFLSRSLRQELESITGVISSFAVRFGEEVAPLSEEEGEETAEEEAPGEDAAGEEAEEGEAEGEAPPEDDSSIAGRMRLFFNFEDLADVLGFGKGASGPGEGDEHITPEHIASVTLPLYVSYQPTPVAIRDIATLQVGDVLFLDHKPSDEVEIRVGKELSFFGHPGAIDNSIGVRISRSRKI